MGARMLICVAKSGAKTNRAPTAEAMGHLNSSCFTELSLALWNQILLGHLDGFDRVGVRAGEFLLVLFPPGVPLVDAWRAGHPRLVAPLLGGAAEALAGEALQRGGGGIAHVAVIVGEKVDQFGDGPRGRDVADDSG